MQNKELLTDQKLQAAFNLFDIDQNGRITLDEIKAMLGESRIRTEIESNNQIWKQFMAEADENGDGEISYEEFKIMMKKMFATN